MIQQLATSAEANPVVLITGASSGIGAALARRLATSGAHLALHGRGNSPDSEARLASVASECRERGASSCLTITGELDCEAMARELVQRTLERHGRLDQIVANAGYARQGGVTASSWASLAAAFAAMPLTFSALVREAVDALSRSACARIVAVSSFVAHRFDADLPFHETAAAKAALEALVQSTAAELANLGITVNGVVPGYTRKDRPGSNPAAWQRAQESTPAQRIATPDDIAASITFLLSHATSHITGQLLHIDGGLTLL